MQVSGYHYDRKAYGRPPSVYYGRKLRPFGRFFRLRSYSLTYLVPFIFITKSDSMLFLIWNGAPSSNNGTMQSMAEAAEQTTAQSQRLGESECIGCSNGSSPISASFPLVRRRPRLSTPLTAFSTALLTPSSTLKVLRVKLCCSMVNTFRRIMIGLDILAFESVRKEGCDLIWFYHQRNGLETCAGWHIRLFCCLLGFVDVKIKVAFYTKVRSASHTCPDRRVVETGSN